MCALDLPPGAEQAPHAALRKAVADSCCQTGGSARTAQMDQRGSGRVRLQLKDKGSPPLQPGHAPALPPYERRHTLTLKDKGSPPAPPPPPPNAVQRFLASQPGAKEVTTRTNRSLLRASERYQAALSQPGEQLAQEPPLADLRPGSRARRRLLVTPPGSPAQRETSYSKVAKHLLAQTAQDNAENVDTINRQMHVMARAAGRQQVQQAQLARAHSPGSVHSVTLEASHLEDARENATYSLFTTPKVAAAPGVLQAAPMALLTPSLLDAST